jgi:hypothetical protein
MYGTTELPSGESAAFEVITPEYADEMLNEHNNNNRPLSITRAELMARKIANDSFMVTGQSHIIIDHNGELLNGQHTLKGVSLARRPIITLVVRNVSPEVFAAIDIGHKRTTGHLFAVKGIRYGTTLGATIRTVERLKVIRSGMASGVKEAIDNDTAFQIYQSNADLWDAVAAEGEALRKLAKSEGLSVPASAVASFLYEAVEAGVEFADCSEFCRRVIRLDGHTPDTPRSSLRRWLAGARLASALRGGSEVQIQTVVVFIKTWNAEVKGTSLRKIYGWSGVSTEIPRVIPRT